MTTTSDPSPTTGEAPERRSIVKVVFASLIGTATEWYDFFLYGSAAALVFGTLFFPESAPVPPPSRVRDLRPRLRRATPRWRRVRPLR